MKAIVISDTHHEISNLQALIPTINSCDLLVHLGDGISDLEKVRDLISCKEIVCVSGNCDYSTRYPSFVVKQIGQERVFFTHGHCQHVKDDLLTLALTAAENKCGYAFYGHTHVSSTDIFYGVTLVNPGSLSRPRFSSPTYCIIEEEKGKIFTNIFSMG